MSQKSVLPTDWYHASCRAVQYNEDYYQIVWTVDQGEHRFQNVMMSGSVKDIKTFDRYRSIFSRFGIVLPLSADDPTLELMVVGVRAMIHVSQYVDDTRPDFIHTKNIVLEMKHPVLPSDVDVFSDKNDYHIMRGTQYGAAKLPIKPTPL
jgi:hypothetical protein